MNDKFINLLLLVTDGPGAWLDFGWIVLEDDLNNRFVSCSAALPFDTKYVTEAKSKGKIIN